MAALFVGSITGTSLTVTSVTSGSIAVGNALFGSNVLQGTRIVSGSGNNWEINLSQNVSSTSLTASSFNTNITAGAPPLLWSDVHEAFRQVNENFDSIASSLGAAGITPIDFETLDTSLKPTSTGVYGLGDITHQWTNVYTGEFTTVYPLNGLWAGNAQIKGIGFTVNLPEGSTIGGDPLTGIGTSLIIDPDKTFFKSVQVDNANRVVANDFADTLNLNSGTAVQLVVDSGAESITINNTGVTQLTAGSGTSVSSTTGNITVTNTGVRSLTSTTSLPSGRTAGAGINIDASTGDSIKITNTGVISITSGVGITVAADSATGEVQIINSAPAGSAFAYVEVNGDSGDRIAADLVTDVLKIDSGTGITLTKNTTTDTLTITVNPNFDLTGNVTGDLLGNVTGDVLGNITGDVLGNVTGDVLGNVTGNTTGYHLGDIKGSVFGDDSSKIVDSVENKIYSTFFGNLTGNVTGNVSGNVTGNVSGNVTSGSVTIVPDRVTTPEIEGVADTLAIYGNWATNTGISIVSTTSFESVTVESERIVGISTNVSGVRKDWIFETTGALTLPTGGYISGDLQGTHTGNVVTSLIDSADSSSITVIPIVTFNSDIVVENDVRIRGSKVLNLSEIKSIVAASTSFSDFQSRIAALV